MIMPLDLLLKKSLFLCIYNDRNSLAKKNSFCTIRYMKVFVPRNIEKWLFTMRFQIGPISVSLFQLVLVAVGAGISLVIWNTIVKSWGNKAAATIVILPVFGIFLFIAFFTISELPLVPFLAKLRRTRFLDTTKKYQSNTTTKIDPLRVSLQASRAMHESVQIQEKKIFSVDDALHKNPLSSDDLWL